MCDPLSNIITAAIGLGAKEVYDEVVTEPLEEGKAKIDQANAQAEKQAKRQEDLINSTAQKARRFDPAGMLYGPKKGDTGSTSLTGPTGIDFSKLLLGKNTLLGS